MYMRFRAAHERMRGAGHVGANHHRKIADVGELVCIVMEHAIEWGEELIPSGPKPRTPDI